MLPYVVAKFSLLFFAAGTPGQSCSLPTDQFFFFPRWWEYLNGQYDAIGTCAPHVNFPQDIWLIGLAVLDMLIRLAGFLAVVSIIVAGFQLVLTEGNPEKATSARNRLINSLVGLAIAFSATAMASLVSNTIHSGTSGTSASGLPTPNASNTEIQNILNVAFAIAGALAFLFTVVAGFRYITSGDNPNKVAEARRQIIYAALGLLIIAMAATIVNFVIGKL